MLRAALDLYPAELLFDRHDTLNMPKRDLSKLHLCAPSNEFRGLRDPT